MNDFTDDTVNFRVAGLSQNKTTPFDLRPSSAFCDVLKAELGTIALRKLSFVGEIRGAGKSDWELTAKLGATVVQPCVVTLAPVTSRIDVSVERLFVAQIDVPGSDSDEEEIEMPDDENADLLGSHIDVTQVMTESLALNLPLYPRTNDAELNESAFTEPGKTPMTDEDARPFAGLAGLRDKLVGDDEK